MDILTDIWEKSPKQNSKVELQRDQDMEKNRPPDQGDAEGAAETERGGKLVIRACWSCFDGALRS